MFIIKKLFRVFLLLSILLLSACNSTSNISILPKEVAPNNCRINGTVITILDTININPSLAKVAINNVVKSGFGFKTPLIKKDTIHVKFQFTISKTTKEQFPSLKQQLPGLSIGDKFIGDVEKIELIQLKSDNTKSEYRIFSYDKLEL